MVDTSLYDDLPNNPELAFRVLENAFRAECDSKLNESGPENNIDNILSQYIYNTITAADELGVSFGSTVDATDLSDRMGWSIFLEFRRTVDTFLIRLNIRTSRRNKEFSVSLNDNTKSKLRGLLEKVKETIDRLDVSDRKRDALHARTAALEAEINRNRTRFEVVAAFWVETCEKAGEGVEKLEPLRKWIDPIGNLIGQAKQEESSPSQAHIPATPRPKQIEDQRSQSMRGSIDDDVPF